MELTHLNSRGEATMVDVSDKKITLREAAAHAVVTMAEQTLKMIMSGDAKKGDVLAAARIAGINGAKKTSELIPLCHIIPIEKVKIDFDIISDTQIAITSYAKCTYKTGIEMEALTAASCAALTIYDMCKAVDRGMVISDICLIRKSGGKSGSFTDKSICGLYIKPVHGADTESVNKITLSADTGIVGDAYAGGGNRQLSLISEINRGLLLSEEGTVCAKRFTPNIVFKGTNPRAGDRFAIGSSVIEITETGRECHQLCELSRSKGSCALVKNAVFAKVIKSGEAEIGDEMYYV